MTPPPPPSSEHPYRAANAARDRDPERGDPCADERGLYALCLCIGVIPVAWALLHADAWGAEPTFGLLLTLFSTRALVASIRRRGPRPTTPEG